MSGRRRWTEEDNEVLRAVYSTATQEELAALFPGNSKESIRVRANRLGLSRPLLGRELTAGDPIFSQRPVWSEEEVEKLKKVYRTASRQELLKLFPGRTSEGIRYKANSFGLCKPKPELRIYSVDDTFFSTPSVLNCYWAGFIAADGNVRSKRNTLSISLAIKDEDHLRQFIQDVEFAGPIRYYTKKVFNNNYDGCSLEINSAQWKEDLCFNFNIVPKKTLILKPPAISLSLRKSLAYIAGYIDGDGSVAVYNNGGYLRPSVNAVGTRAVLEYIDKILQDNVFVSKAGSLTRRGKIYSLSYAGKASLAIYSFLKTLPIPLLRRKWDRLKHYEEKCRG